ncbi:sterol desaturase family protein [Magnetofaba australis]|uniref:Putative sterol desaturase-like protein n=1 Tax=Magnetofaba australis IT-1 TaxID=1434232 RepID=A0A1Y2JZ64_9PROT|nr:sterol desaturase family protein [Magnetofaba australis]OSM00188.1 putative sterol desaturase-like protein [Magnetofaba australis IT-1]
MNAQFFLNHEALIRLGCFVAVLAVIVGWELRAPRRALSLPRVRRWPANITIVALNTLLLRLIFPTAAVGVAHLGQAQSWGLLNQWQIPPAVALLLGVALLDLAIYLQHVMVHAIPTLWRLHRMHHADLDYDVTTGSRFHPLEILLSMGIKFGVIAALGPSALAVMLFEILLNASAMFNHGNIRLPLALDRWLRWVIVTPDMHRVHHSVVMRETNSNFGFCLPWWDRLMGTYRAQPAAGHTGMTIGLEAWRDPRDAATLWGLLRMPFRSAAGPTMLDGGNRRLSEVTQRDDDD